VPIDLPPCVLDHAERGGRPAAIGSVLSDEHPLRVHWSTPGDEALAERVLALAEHAWDVQVDQLGFRPPVLPDAADGPELDLYLDAVGEGEAGVAADALIDATPGDGFSSTSAWVVLDRGLGDDELPSFVAHEFNHVLQWATDFTEDHVNLWEATATAAQAWTLPADEARWAADVPDFQEAPWAPALLGDGDVLWPEFELGWAYEYGAALWMMHLADVHGDDVGARIWNAAASEGDGLEPDFLDAIVEQEGTLADAMSGIAARRWFVGSRWDQRGLAEAAGWGPDLEVPVEAALERGDLPADVAFSPALRVTGQGFVRVDAGPGEAGDRVFFRVGSEEALDSALVVWGADGSEHRATGRAPLGVPREAGPFVAAVTNLGHLDFDGDDDPWGPGDQVLTVTIRPVLSIEVPAEACDCSLGAGRGEWWLAFGVAGVILRRRRVAR
jgi:hypothetical protein